MTARGRERELAEAFVEIADTLVDGYDVIDMLHTLVSRCAEIFGAADAGILIPNENGVLEVVASTSERSHLISLLQLDAGEGPCVDAYRTGLIVEVDRIAGTYARWPQFATDAAAQGYESMYAIPMRLREQTIGSLNLFSDRPGPIDAADAVAAKSLTDIATIAILHERALREADLAREQLKNALNSRVRIEQAKGVIAHTDGVDMDEAFARLRTQARNSGRLLSVVAQEVIDSARTR